MPAVTSTAPESERNGNGGGNGTASGNPNDEGLKDGEGEESRISSKIKHYIMREKQRKKKEYEAEVEEERQRKEREARQRQDVMTLEETKEQIDQLEQKLKQLEKEKQQLFMQLKKVLNEDEIRKRQQAKENSEMAPMKMQMGNIQIPMFLPPTSTGQGEPPPNQGRPPPLTSHILNKGNMQSVGGGGVKRARSPSPGPYPPHNMYQHRIHHQPQLKHQPVYSDHAPPQHKMEDGRMGRQMARAVLWNKPTQYNQGAGVSNAGAYYTHLPTSGGVVVGERPPPLLYAHHAHTPHTPHTPHHAGLMYAPSPQPQLYLDIVKHREQGQQHQDKKDVQPQVLIGLSEPHHASGAVGVNVTSYGAAPNQPPVSRHHVTVHGNIPMHNNVQGPKPGSITQGYPVRQPNPNVQNPNMYPNRHRY